MLEKSDRFLLMKTSNIQGISWVTCWGINPITMLCITDKNYNIASYDFSKTKKRSPTCDGFATINRSFSFKPRCITLMGLKTVFLFVHIYEPRVLERIKKKRWDETLIFMQKGKLQTTPLKIGVF